MKFFQWIRNQQFSAFFDTYFPFMGEKLLGFYSHILETLNQKAP
jgi:hypothetical protein